MVFASLFRFTPSSWASQKEPAAQARKTLPIREGLPPVAIIGRPDSIFPYTRFVVRLTIAHTFNEIEVICSHSAITQTHRQSLMRDVSHMWDSILPVVPKPIPTGKFGVVAS